MAIDTTTPEWKAFEKRCEEGNRRLKRSYRWIGVKSFFGGLFDGANIWGMYAQDPTTARRSIVYTASRQLQHQRAINEQNRAQDQAADIEHAKLMGRVMADEMMARVQEHRGQQRSTA